MKKKAVIFSPIIILSIISVVLTATFIPVRNSLYTRKNLELTYDGAYYDSETASEYGQWHYEKTYAGYEYYLFIPEKFRKDVKNENAKLPLIVVFHGSGEKGASLGKYGRKFINEEFQKNIHPEGAAVLIILSRISYFTDPKGTSLLIQNICIKNKCLDKTNIIGYGFSQGAKFVVELACAEPALFRAVISGSGFYNITRKELISVLPVQFYSAVSENDKGIFEQGCIVGRLCGRWCKNSYYKQYEQRWHFWVELDDKLADGDETVMDWLVKIVNSSEK